MPEAALRVPVLEPEGRPRAKVALFLGCVADSLYPETNLNTARVLQKNGCEVWIPRSQGCCGGLRRGRRWIATVDGAWRSSCGQRRC